MTGHLFCFGLGYSAGYLAQRLTRQGWTISGTATTTEGASRLKTQGYRGFVFDGTNADPEIADVLNDATHVLLSIPPTASGDPALSAFADSLARSPRLDWIGYLSTVGVYGDAGGDWVDEETPANPGSQRGRRRLDAENQWLAFGQRTGRNVMIFRLPGIYGPGRSAIDDVRAGTARRIIKPGQVFNRIHVGDIAGTLEAAIARPHGTRIYNVTDDEPCPPQDVVAYAAHLLGLALPPPLDFATAELSPIARSFYSESKKVRNTRIKNELGVSLQFPTYREGLTALAHGS